MSFLFNPSTKITAVSGIMTEPVRRGIGILERDASRVFDGTFSQSNGIVLEGADGMDEEAWSISVSDSTAVIRAGDDLGFVYALLHISEKYLGIKPFWFWLDQPIQKRASAELPCGEYRSEKAAVRFRGWFFNDEVLIMGWKYEKAWEMAFEALLRCGGNTAIPGTDKNSRLNRQLAADMGLWITHHHAEPLGAEIFVRAYPGEAPNFFENSELFYKLWEDAVKEQKDYKVIWNICFRGQGDKPFWSDDTSGRFDTPEKRGALISEVMQKQCDIVKKYVDEPVFCTNLYGELMELYKDGFITLPEGVIKVKADNGYGKMVTRRRDGLNLRVASMPEKNGGAQGIYYHVSFYDLQAANHITMLPNSVSFVDKELSEVLANDGGDFWVINCSNVRPHAYYLDAVRKKWSGLNIDDASHSAEFAADYYGGSETAAHMLEKYPKVTLSYGKHDDEHAGEQIYTENSRLIAHGCIVKKGQQIPGLRWLTGDVPLTEQLEAVTAIVDSGEDALTRYAEECERGAAEVGGEYRALYSSVIVLQSKIHALCAQGLKKTAQSALAFENGDYMKAFVLAGDAAELFNGADDVMRGSEYGVWKNFYFNDCFADIKHSAFMARKLMGVIREYGDNARHDKWYRELMYAPEDRNVFMLLVLDNHMTDDEIYKEIKRQEMAK